MRLGSNFFFVGILLLFLTVVRVQGQADYADNFPLNTFISCGIISTSNTDSANIGDSDTRKCQYTNIDICSGEKIFITQCSNFDGDGMLRLYIDGTFAVANDDYCGSASGAGITYTYTGSGCKNALIYIGGFENRASSGETKFQFQIRRKRCGFGFYSNSMTTCAAVNTGCIQPNVNHIGTNACPTTCPAGTSPNSGRTCDQCPVGTIAATAGLGTCTACPNGYEAVSGNTVCQICPAGFYNDMSATTGKVCVKVNAGCFSPTAGATTACPQACPAGYYSEGGATSCKHCAAAATPSYGGSLPIGNWIGTQTRTSNMNLATSQYTTHCACANGFTGWVCNEPACPTRVPGLSLGSLLITADSKLGEYARTFDSLSADQKNIAVVYFRRLLTVDIDINGDGSISRKEMVDALRYRTVNVDSSLTNDISFRLWCSTGNANSGICYTDSVTVKAMADDGERNFYQSNKHRFDGSGVSNIGSISAIYPNPTMSASMCKDYDAELSSLENAAFATMTTEWNFVSPTSDLRWCGYDTGILHSLFDTRYSQATTNLIRGNNKLLELNTPFANVPKKSIFCMYLNTASASYECVTGLFYDGTPIDLQPELTDNGVVFQYLDTSSSEVQFDIFVGDLGSLSESKTFVVGINYMSESCGRISKPISFSDKISMNMVGVVREYSIRAIQTIGDQLKKTDWSTMPYRIPFLVQISGKVQTASGTGVGNVLISYCHIDPVTGVNSIMPGYCPLITFTTNKFGEYAGEIRVSNKDWVNTAEHFNVTASLVDNNGITHTFSPAIQAVTVNHLVDAIISFTDNTTIAVVGTVTYDPLNVNNNVCPFEKLPLKLVDDADDKTTMTSDVEGAFSFSNTQGVGFTFTIDPYNGRTWRFRLISQGQTWTQGVQYSVTTNSDGSVDVKVNKVFAIADIRIDVFDTSLQTVNIGMFGGTGKAYLDLGSSTTFDIIPVDTRCLYKRTVDMSANFFENQIPAMNYQVVLTAAPNLPIVGTRNPTGLNPSGRFYCDPSKVPLTYFTEVGQLVQPLNIDVLNSSYIYRVEYIYFSGICFELLGSGTDKLAVTPATSQTDTQACYPIATKVFQEGETMKITVRLFEIYPTRNTGDNTAMNKTFAVENVTLSIEDQVGGFNSFIDYPYNTTLYRPFPTSEPIPYALDYSIIGGNPFPSSPFSYTFTVRVQRNGPDPEVYQLAISRTSNKWIIPVVGQVAKEVPNFYPVATDPTLIFMVIRDPPGGNSFTTWHSGTSIEFGMSLNSMQTFDGAASFELSGGAGVEAEADAGVAFGGFFATTVLSVSAGFGGRTMDVGSISTSRASDSHYQYSMSFSYDISTSTDPNIAGHASDVIIGGGVDLIVSEATEVYILSETATVRCLAKRDTFQWHPGHTTTFILPVIEIEDTVRNLGSLYDRTADTTVKSQLSKQIQNWATVLANYRDYNNNLTNVFTGDEALFNKMVQAYDQWNSKTLSTSEFLKAADSAMYPRKVISVNVGKVIKSILGMDPSQYGVNLKVNVPFNEKILDPAKMVPFNLVEPSLQDAAQQFDRRFTQSFRSTSSSCGNVLPQYQNDVMKGVCSDFAPGKWNNLFTAINSACNMPIDPGSTKSSLADIPLLNKVCQRRSAVKDASKIPGGVVESGTDSIFGFLKDPKKFVTFGATSPVTMSWTSSVTDTRAFTTELDTSRSRFMFDSSFGTDLTVSAANFQVFLENHAEQMQTIHIGKTSESSHSFERTVTVTLDDSDLGDYFAVRVTEDPVYATPIFTTMGGQSKCPGESMTSRRESNVRIMSIEHRCGYGGDEICDFRTLGDNGVAYFAAIIYNDSPTNEPVDYTIGLANSFSEYGTTCGTRGKITGLQVDFDQTDLGDIPYRKQIEVPFRVRRNSVYHCHNYVDVEVAITATCEEASSSSYVYQYGLVSNSAGVKEISYDTANVMNEATSSATFSLSWAIVSRPSNAPTFAPTASPSQTPSFGPTISPTLSQNPTQVPTTLSPTPTPTTTSPSQIPTRNPTRIPTRNPTKSPSTGVRRQLGEVNMEEDERDSLRNQVDELTKKMDSVLNALNLMSEETKKSK